MGHLDLIKRYDTTILEDKLFIDYIEAILKKVIENGKGIELNTSSFRYNLPDLMPSTNILKLYKELGGEIITVGSDAHDSIRVGENISYTYDILKSLDFKYVFTFNKRNKHGILI